ncbi:MAG: hypothetical protein IKJ89_09100 [Kiritimatiellae bacterium]|nr:hypothetical protein [Kiritimatiellia bacterium]
MLQAGTEFATWADSDAFFTTPLLMVLYFYVMQSRQVLVTFKSAAALWRADRWKPIVAGAVNLALRAVDFHGMICATRETLRVRVAEDCRA